MVAASVACRQGRRVESRAERALRSGTYATCRVPSREVKELGHGAAVRRPVTGAELAERLGSVRLNG